MRNYKIITLPRAEQDIEGIAEYIGVKLNAPRSAEKFLDNLDATYERLSEFPEMGTEIKRDYPLKNKYRWVLIDNYILFYTVMDETVNVVRVVYQSSNYLHALK